jgi:hypothetical protein
VSAAPSNTLLLLLYHNFFFTDSLERDRGGVCLRVDGCVHHHREGICSLEGGAPTLRYSCLQSTTSTGVVAPQDGQLSTDIGTPVVACLSEARASYSPAVAEDTWYFCAPSAHVTVGVAPPARALGVSILCMGVR